MIFIVMCWALFASHGDSSYEACGSSWFAYHNLNDFLVQGFKILVVQGILGREVLGTVEKGLLEQVQARQTWNG